MSIQKERTPMTKGNLEIQEKDYIVDLSFIFGPDVTHMKTEEKWATLTKGDGGFGGSPWFLAEKSYIADTVREIVEKYKLYELFMRKQFVFQIVLRDYLTWGIHSHVVPFLPDLGPQGFRVRLDEVLSHNLDREDVAWAKIETNLQERNPWQGVISEGMIPWVIKRVRKSFNEGLWKEVRQNKAVFLGIKNIPENQLVMIENRLGGTLKAGVFVPESFWQLEFIDKHELVDDPLEQFHQQV